ncbi:thymidylate synthase [Methanococcoides methylutens]|uniref:Thymidylate synthase n=1 Tax=Methanococcoides methylutens TaxID=2226 RepID=A0A099T1W2_METMT|nr:YigZ family protein [Methanococcoides methylutens]KGK98236.1 thymidylate synthase [Methanococcoides methylutens]
MYRTVRSDGVAQKEFKNSVFIGHAAPIKNEADAKAFVLGVKERYSDANHNVSAYLIKNCSTLVAKYDDDGEPAGSSGKPVFKVLELKELSNVAVVVTRYFGGVKLGFGGLSRAYREAAVAAIEEAGIIEVHEMTALKLNVTYSDIQPVKKLVEEYGHLLDENYTDIVELSVEVRKGTEDDLISKVTDLTRNRATVAYING